MQIGGNFVLNPDPTMRLYSVAAGLVLLALVNVAKRLVIALVVCPECTVSRAVLVAVPSAPL